MIIALSIVLAAVPLLFCYAARAFLGRDRLQPVWVFPMLFLAGAGGGVLFGAVLSPNLAVWFTGLFELGDARLVNAAVVVPLAEEIGKGLVLLVFLSTRWYRSPVDGLLYGLAAGAGFAMVENVLSFLAAYEFGGGEGWANTVLIRLPAALLVHGGGTAILGLYLGAARWAQTRLVVFGALPAALFFAGAIHGGWNLLVELGGARGGQAYFIAAGCLLMVVTGVLATALAISLRVEASDLRAELRGEVTAGYVDAEAVHELTLHRTVRRRGRSERDRELEASEGALVSLAFALRRLRVEGRGAEDVERLRRHLRGLRDQGANI